MGTAVRSRRLFGPTQLGAVGATALYTVPAGRTAVFRGISLANVNAAVTEGRVMLNGTTSAFLVWIGTIAAKSSLPVPLELVLDPADVLYGQCVTGGTNITFAGFGSLLLGAPS